MPDSELPLPDYDELPLASLRHRVRSLTADELRRLLEHEHAHADRVPVVEVLTARLRELEAGATPAGGDQRDPTDAPEHTPRGSPVGPATAAEGSTPLRHGVAGQTPRRGRP